MFTFGCAYYPDYLPELSLCRTPEGCIETVSWQEAVRFNLERMIACHIGSIRMGEFSWATVEPERGKFDFSRFLYTLDQAQSMGIDVIFCTPTATPPKWLVDEMPDILPVTRAGQVIPFGSRRHYDVNSEKYRAESKRISRAYAEALGKHPAVVGWQTDNEFGCHNSVFLFTEAAKRSFQDWLKTKYQTIERLNEEWFCGFWSQKYNNFEQIELPFLSWADQNPHLELDFRRFSNEQYRSFQKEQVDVIKELSPGRYITHNLMTLFNDLCPWMASGDLDKVGFDHYQMDKEPHPVTSHWQFALMYSLKMKPFAVLEQQPLQVNWHAVNQRFHYSWLFLWTMQAMSLGADGVYYFSWQRFAGGAEQYHDGIIPHDLRVKESWQESALKSMHKLFNELAERFSLNQLPEPQIDVVCVYDSESLWSHEITAQSAIYSTRRQVDFVARFCHSTGLGLGFAATIGDALSRGALPRLIVLPGYAFALTAEEQNLLSAYLAAGGKVLSFPRTAMKKRNNQMSPLPLSFLADDELCLSDYGAMLEGEREQFSDKSVLSEKGFFEGELWAEKIEVLKNWQVLARFISGLYKDAPAVLRREGNGKFIHIATCPVEEPAFFSWLLEALELEHLTSPTALQLLPLQLGERKFIASVNFSEYTHCFSVRACAGFTACMADTFDINAVSGGTIAVPARAFAFVEFK